MNRLDHGISYSKVLEIRTTIANSKLSSSTTLIPNYIHQHIPTTAVYDNIDRLEETLSKSDTTHQVNGVLVHQAFIGPSLPPEKKTELQFLNMYYQFTMVAEYQNFMFFHALIRNYEQKAFKPI